MEKSPSCKHKKAIKKKKKKKKGKNTGSKKKRRNLRNKSVENANSLNLPLYEVDRCVSFYHLQIQDCSWLQKRLTFVL